MLYLTTTFAVALATLTTTATAYTTAALADQITNLPGK